MPKYAFLLFALLFSSASFGEAPFGAGGGGTPDEMAGQAYGASGCGIGAMLWGSEPGMAQAMAVTTNLILFNQSFGLSFGSLGCLSDDETAQAVTFSDENRETLLADIARGEGEAVLTLGELLHCSPAAALAPTLQARFAEFAPTAASKQGLGPRLVKFVREDKSTQALCPRNRT